MEYRIDLTGNVPQAAAAGAAALRAEGAAAQGALTALSGFGAAASAMEASTRAAQSLAEALRDVAKANADRGAAFSTATDADFKRSKWDTSPPRPGETPDPSKAATASSVKGTGAAAGVAKAGKQAKDGWSGVAGSVGKAALGVLAYGAAMAGIGGLSDLTRMAIGWRALGQLQLISYRATMDLRRSVAGVDAQPLVRAASRLEENLSKSTVTGQALSGILTRGFNAAFAAAERLEPLLSNTFQLAVLGALKLEGAWLDLRIALQPLTAAIGPLGSAIGEVMSAFAESTEGMGLWGVALNGVGEIARDTATYVSDLAGILSALSKGDYAKAFTISVLGEEGGKAIDAGRASESSAAAPMVVDPALHERERARARDGGRAVGEDLGDGAVGGINSKRGAVGAAAESLTMFAVAKAREGADAHSPSRATERLGRDMGQGEVIGLEKEAPRVAEAAQTALVPGVDAAGVGASGKSAAPGTSSGLTLGPVSFTFAVDARGAREGVGDDLRAALLALAPDLAQEVFRILSLRLGAPVT